MIDQLVVIPGLIDDRLNSTNGMAVQFVPVDVAVAVGPQGNWDRVFIATAAITVIAGLCTKFVCSPTRLRASAKRRPRVAS